MQPEALVYHSFEIWKTFGNFPGGNWVALVSEGFVEFSLELGLDGRVQSEMIGNSAQSAGKRIVSKNSGEEIKGGKHLTWRRYPSQRPAE